MSNLKTNPIIAGLQPNESSVLVTGFVGKCENGRVRLHGGLNLGAYLEVDAGDVIHEIDSDRADEPVRLYLRDSAEIEIVSSSKISAVTLRQKDDTWGGSGNTCADKSFDFWWDCVRRPGSNVDDCTERSRQIERMCKVMSDAFADVAKR